jgi:RHS repeat-associated protein
MLKKGFPAVFVLFLTVTLFAIATPAHSEDSVVFAKGFAIGYWHLRLSYQTFNSDNSDEGIFIIQKTTPDKRINGGFVLLNGQFIFLRDFLRGAESEFVKDVELNGKNHLAVFLRGTPKASLHFEIRIKNIIQPPEVTFTTVPKSIALGDSSTFGWSTKNADSCTIEPDIGSVGVDGSFKVSPTETTTYTLTATGPGGSLSAAETVTVTYPPPEVSIGADKGTIEIGQSTTLSWVSKYAAWCAIAPGIGNVERSGSMLVSPTETTTYTITAESPGGNTTDSTTVTVNDPTAPPTVNFSVTPPEIEQGGSATLSWASFNGNAAHIDNGIGAVEPNGSIPVSPEHTSAYTLTVTGPTGSTNARAVVTVLGNQLPQPQGSFGAQYEDLIPDDATAEAYDAKRFSLITGLVRDLGGSPIPDVSISIHNHPEYGTVTTNAEGRFYIPVEGGGNLIVNYLKEGLIPIHRKVYVPWNDTAVIETVAMIVQDSASTTMTFDGNPNTVVTSKSTQVTDEYGTRAFTMVLTGDNQAYLVDENGNDVQELTTITTRATEYTTPESMPAKLPPTSGFTYCTELRVDGAERVRFEKPVIVWVDNFLGLPVGLIVPVGYYDRDRGVWVPDENGVVVALLDTDADGAVDALDADGDGRPDDLNGDQSYSDEVQGLNDSQRYAAGSTFWRAATTHFSPCDLNLPFWVAQTSIPPNPKGKSNADQASSGGSDSGGGQASGNQPPGNTQCLASFVEQRGRIFHEDINIPGTNMTLHYASNRVAGYKPGVFTIPASGDTVPGTLVKIVVQLSVAGKDFEVELPAESNQIAEIEWDGLDNLGRPVTGTVIAHIRIGFVYNGFYTAPPNVARAFGLSGTSALTIPTRQQWTLWQDSEVTVTRGEGTLAEGWSISSHHQLSPSDTSVLFKGDGTITRNNVAVIDAYAGDGSGSQDYGGMGGSATEAQIPLPSSLSMDLEGNLYIFSSHLANYQDFQSHILKVDTQGIVSELFYASMRFYHGYMASDPQGNLYWSHYVVWGGGAGEGACVTKRTPEGVITTVFGACARGEWSYSGISFAGIHVDNQGNLYTASPTLNQVLKRDTAGAIRAVAGTGTRGHGGDGGFATQAQLYHPEDVFVDGEGNLYIAEYERVRKVDPSGIITTVAGGGPVGTLGDGGPATGAYLQKIEALAMDAESNLYIADSYHHLIRKVNKSGTISSVAGINYQGGGEYSGDGGAATNAKLYSPTDILIDPAGNLFITDMLKGRVRKVNPTAAVLKQGMAATDIAFAEESGIGYIMSSAGLHKKTTDIGTGITLNEFGYDAKNNLISVTDQFGNLTSIERDSNGVPTAIISPDGIRTELIIDANNHLIRINYADGSTYEFEYTADGLMTLEVEPQGNRFEHIFDDKGRLTNVTDEEGGHWSYTRAVDENGDVLVEMATAENNVISYLDNTDFSGIYTSTVTDSTGGQTAFSKSSDGLTVNQSLACGMDLDFIYDVDPEYKFKVLSDMAESAPSGLARVTQLNKTYKDTDSNDIPDLITDTVTVNDKTTTLIQNTLLSQKVVTSPEGRTVTTLYNPNTLLTESVSIPGLFDTNYGYDTRGKLTSIATNTRPTTATYNAQGFLETVTDPGNQTTTYSYDPVGRIADITRPDGGFVGFTYDKNGNMTVLTNPVDVAHGFGFNTVNRNNSYATPLSGSYSYIYDRDRRLVRTNFPSGKSLINDYADPEDPTDHSRLWQIRTPEGNIDFTYLCGTKVDSIAKGRESITYGYDGKLLTSETLAGTLNQSLTYTRNNDFDVSRFTYAGAPVSYSYDNDGLLTGAGAFTITRNAENGLPETVAGGALNLARTFNGYGEVESQAITVNSQNVASWSLIRDNNGRITDKTETVPGTLSGYVYTYDAMGRLWTVTKDSTLVEKYQYDLNGTRTYEMNTLRGIAGRTYSYSDEDHILSAGSVTYVYDIDGFLTTKTDGHDVTNYSYSSRGELLSVTQPDGRVVEYIHDPIGRRIAKKVNGSIVEKYLWQGLTRLLAVYDSSDTLLMRFEYADDRMPVAMIKEGVKYYLIYDQMGSLRVVADAAGNVVKSIEYDSFGNILDDSNPSYEIPFGFAGGLHDRDINLVRFGYRDYDPDVGRWTAKDPILFAGGDTDLYGYVLNNPINAIDPLGLEMYRHGYAPKPFGQQVGELGNLLKPSLGKVDPGALKPGADSTTGPLTFYGAGSSLIITGAAVTKAGAGIIAGGGPVGWVGGSIVTATGIVIWGSGVWTVYQGWNIDHSDPCP